MPHVNTPEYMKAWRQKRKELHLCEKCGKQDADTLAGRCRCKACSDRANERRRNKWHGDSAHRAENLRQRKDDYAWMKRHHYCISCKKVDAYTMAGHAMCADCAAERTAEEKLREGRLEKRRKNQKKRVQRRKESGLCTNCGKPLPKRGYPYLTCERCRAKDRDRRRRKREATGALSQAMYKELGLCVTCGRPRVKNKVGWDGREIMLCERCYANSQKWAAAGRNAFVEKHGMSYRSWAVGNEFRMIGARRSQQNNAAKK